MPGPNEPNGATPQHWRGIGELPKLCEKISILMQANVLIADWGMLPLYFPIYDVMVATTKRGNRPISYQDVALC